MTLRPYERNRLVVLGPLCGQLPVELRGMFPGA
jgi:hypothetical protein